MQMTFRVGERIPGTDFVIEEEAAQTDSSLVYRVRSETIRRSFCAKVLRDKALMTQRDREIRALAEVSSPHIVKLFRTVELEESPILILDWIDGESLEKAVATRGALGPDEVVEVARQMCQALHEVHRRDLVHRDVSPANVMIARHTGDELFATLLDFGGAKKPSAHVTTGWGQTRDFPSPELLRGTALDRRSDIYQLGCLLFFALTGTAPFEGNDAIATQKAHLFQEPTRVSSHVPVLRRSPLDDLLLRMMAKLPEQRPQDCAEVLAALDETESTSFATAAGPVPSKSRANASLSVIGPNQSVVTASGSHIVVQLGNTESHFEVDDGEITAVEAQVDRVIYGTAGGAVSTLDIATGRTTNLARIPRERAIVALSSTATAILAVDSSAAAYAITSEGSYRRVGPSGARLIAGAAQSEAFAVITDSGTVEIYPNARESRKAASLSLDYDAKQAVMSPDGYILAILGEGITWLVSALNGALLHQIEITPRTETVTFSDGTLVGVNRTLSGKHQFFELSS